MNVIHTEAKQIKTASNRLEMLAGLFDYPSVGFRDRVNGIVAAFRRQCPAAADELAPFLDFVESSSLIDIQEVFTRSFDVQAITTLDIGYVLFGDDYKRGILLVNLNREETEAGVDPGSELADHLPTVLRLLGRLQDQELQTELAEKIVLPALEKISSEFTPERLDHKSKVYAKHYKTLIERAGRNPLIYLYPLRAASMVLHDLFRSGVSPLPANVDKADGFLGSVRQEIILEG